MHRALTNRSIPQIIAPLMLPCVVLFSGEPPFSEQHIVLVWDLGNPEASLFFGGSGQKGAKSSCYLEVGVIPLH